MCMHLPTVTTLLSLRISTLLPKNRPLFHTPTPCGVCMVFFRHVCMFIHVNPLTYAQVDACTPKLHGISTSCCERGCGLCVRVGGAVRTKDAHAHTVQVERIA
jgi:hypothetical protein